MPINTFPWKYIFQSVWYTWIRYLNMKWSSTYASSFMSSNQTASEKTKLFLACMESLLHLMQNADWRQMWKCPFVCKSSATLKHIHRVLYTNAVQQCVLIFKGIRCVYRKIKLGWVRKRKDIFVVINSHIGSSFFHHLQQLAWSMPLINLTSIPIVKIFHVYICTSRTNGMYMFNLTAIIELSLSQ